MATDLLLNNQQDLVVVDGDLAFVEGGEQIAQAWAITMRTVIGAHFIDETFGVDYFGRIFGKSDEVLRNAEFRRATLSVEGIVEITFFDVEVNRQAREINVRARARTSDGEQIELQTGIQVLP